MAKEGSTPGEEEGLHATESGDAGGDPLTTPKKARGNRTLKSFNRSQDVLKVRIDKQTIAVPKIDLKSGRQGFFACQTVPVRGLGRMRVLIQCVKSNLQDAISHCCLV